MNPSPHTLRLVRTDRPITLDQWQSALADTPGVRLNRRTPAASDAEIWLATDRTWLPGLDLRNGEVVLADQPAFHHPGHPVRDALEHLARLLGARVVDGAGRTLPWSPSIG